MPVLVPVPMPVSGAGVVVPELVPESRRWHSAAVDPGGQFVPVVPAADPLLPVPVDVEVEFVPVAASGEVVPEVVPVVSDIVSDVLPVGPVLSRHPVIVSAPATKRAARIGA